MESHPRLPQFLPGVSHCGSADGWLGCLHVTQALWPSTDWNSKKPGFKTMAAHPCRRGFLICPHSCIAVFHPTPFSKPLHFLTFWLRLSDAHPSIRRGRTVSVYQKMSAKTEQSTPRGAEAGGSRQHSSGGRANAGLGLLLGLNCSYIMLYCKG